MSKPSPATVCCLISLTSVLLTLTLLTPVFLMPRIAGATEIAASPEGAQETAGAEASETITLKEIPVPDLQGLETAVSEVLIEQESKIEQLKASADLEAITLSDAYGELGLLYHAHSLWQAAEAAYSNASMLAPKELTWIYALGLVYRELSDLEKAKAQFELSLQMVERNLPVLIQLAQVHLELNQPAAAASMAQKAMSVSPLSPAALMVLGEVALSERRYPDAIRDLELALEQHPEANRLHYPLALAYRGTGDLEKAREHLAARGEVGVAPPDPVRSALEERKTGERVFLLKGRRAFAAGDFDAAVTAFARALEAEPTSLRARVNLGSALGMAGQRDEGMAELQKVLAQEPTDAAANFNVGLLLVMEKKDEAALPYLQLAADHNPGDAEAHYQLGMALKRQGNIEKAVFHLQQAVGGRPTDQQLRLTEAQLLLQLGRYQEARERLLRAHLEMPDQGLIMHALARLLAAAPDLSVRDGGKAVEMAARVFQATGEASHGETLAMAFAEAGKCDDAKRLQELLLQEAKDQGAEDHSRRLEATLAIFNSDPCRIPGNAPAAASSETTDTEPAADSSAIKP